MRFGMSTACFFPNLYVEETIDVIGGMNIDTIEVFFSCLGEYKPAFVAELRQRAEARGISVYSVHAFSLQFEPQLFTRHMRSRQEAEGIFRQVLEAGAALGSGVYVFHGPVRLKRLAGCGLDYDDIAGRTDELAGIAAEYGIRLAWENVHYCWYEAPEFAREMLRRVRTDNLYFTLDIKQAAQAGFEPLDFLPDTAGRLVNIHLCDYVRGPAGAAPRLPFSGELDAGALKEALADAGYDAGVMLEVYCHNYEGHAQLAQSFFEMRDRLS
jgi:Sugar phosphate isomerases/epimerases